MNRAIAHVLFCAKKPTAESFPHSSSTTKEKRSGRKPGRFSF
jgi:hypothetical protein